MLTAMPEIETDNFVTSRWILCPPSSTRVVCWNIDRGLHLSRIIEFLGRSKADIVLLQESDLNARRTDHLNIARETAQKLQLNYVFGVEFQELTQGTRKSPAYHGQATLSRWPLLEPTHPPTPTSIRLLAAALVSAGNRALPGKDWRTARPRGRRDDRG